MLFILLAVLALGLGLAQSPIGQLSTRDVHALLWLSDGRILLGHHDGIQVSKDGGKTWQDLVRRSGWDAMNLASDGKRLVVAGHDVYAQSTDFKTFQDLKPQGLSGMDFHGYAIHPNNPSLHYAYEATGGMHLSRDGGKTWSKLPQGTPVMAVGTDGTLYMAASGLGLLQNKGKGLEPIPGPEPDLLVLRVAPDGSLYAGGKRGLWQRTSTGWKQLATKPVVMLAVNPKQPSHVVWVDGSGQVWQR